MCLRVEVVTGVQLSYGFTGSTVSTLCINKAMYFCKDRKPAARRHIVLTVHDPRTEPVHIQLSTLHALSHL